MESLPTCGAIGPCSRRTRDSHVLLYYRKGVDGVDMVDTAVLDTCRAFSATVAAVAVFTMYVLCHGTGEHHLSRAGWPFDEQGMRYSVVIGHGAQTLFH